MTQLEFRSNPTVELIDWMPRVIRIDAPQLGIQEYVESSGDRRVAQAARVSSGTDQDTDQRNRGLLNMLMRDRHGSPFEHVVFTWRIETPIFVAREFFRHRIASYNEVSARYTELKPVFYRPEQHRFLIQEGKPGAYAFTHADENQHLNEEARHRAVARYCWEVYQQSLQDGIAREVARNHLPVSIYTSFYVTMNLRSLLNFLSLRLFTEDSSVPTFPLYEIQQVARLMEDDATKVVPQIMKLFNENGRVPV